MNCTASAAGRWWVGAFCGENNQNKLSAVIDTPAAARNISLLACIWCITTTTSQCEVVLFYSVAMVTAERKRVPDNTTLLLDSLLNGYDRRFRPDFGGKPVEHAPAPSTCAEHLRRAPALNTARYQAKIS